MVFDKLPGWTNAFNNPWISSTGGSLFPKSTSSNKSNKVTDAYAKVSQQIGDSAKRASEASKEHDLKARWGSNYKKN